MKTARTLFALLLMLTGFATTLFAADGPPPPSAGSAEMIKMIRQQQQAAEQQIVALWTGNQRGEVLSKVLADYVTRELRLRSIGGTTETGSLLAAVLKHGPSPDSPEALGQALVLEHYRRQGIDLTSETFVQGTYLIKLATAAQGD